MFESGKLSIAAITKAFKATKPGTTIKIKLNNPASRSKIGYVTLMDIKKDRLLTTALNTSSDKSGDYSIDDVLDYDVYKD